ncbi:hypothetical protein BKA14_001951 [Actinoplanes abujensis]|uniref:Uncharacterized protein n=1 Tax=Paractinoplanes abujensis TaxID=882441 RepID=A0A7W7CR85_9ACTN|nr:hypothetical protein [Actinoplanes abujensis]
MADALGQVLTARGCVTAVIDTDMLAQFGPPPKPNPGPVRFYDQLKCANLAAVWANFKAAGAQFVVVSAGIDSLTLRQSYVHSLADCEVRLVRLTADDDIVRSRLRQRDTGPRLEQHLRASSGDRRTPTDIEDFTVTNDRAAADAAQRILVLAGWSDHLG